VLNSLEPYIEVQLVGGTTHGKPVGAASWSRCDLAITPITFRTLNANSEGDYFDGLTPDCPAPDDLMHELGDPAEARLQAALTLFETGQCPVSTQALRPDASEPRVYGGAVVRRSEADTIGVF
jgi:hypothetical protein